MIPEHVHLHYRENGTIFLSGATIVVPGLGKVTIDKCLSEETIKSISIEVCAALTLRLGMKPK